MWVKFEEIEDRMKKIFIQIEKKKEREEEGRDNSGKKKGRNKERGDKRVEKITVVN